MKAFAFIAATAVASAASAVVYNGNGATGFGGAVGNGSVTITDTATNMTVTATRGSGDWNDALVLYFNSVAGGANDTNNYTDNADGGRTAISGVTGNGRTTVLFPPAFGADYAMVIENGYIGVFGLVENGSHNFLFGSDLVDNNQAASYSITLDATQMAQIGLAAGSGQSFGFVGSYISPSGYRSNETIGASVTQPIDGAGNAGFTGTQSFSLPNSYTLVVPEPASMSLLALAGAGLLGRRRAVRA